MSKVSKKGSKSNKRSAEEVVEEEVTITTKVTEEEVEDEEDNKDKKKKSKKDKKSSKEILEEVEAVPEPIEEEKPKSKRSKKDKTTTEETEEKKPAAITTIDEPQFQPIIINPERQKESKDIADTLTLAERLALASKDIADWEDELDESSSAKDGNNNEGGKTSEVLTADSLVILLQQALQTKDNALLNQCLLCTNHEVIITTIARLPTNRVGELLQSLVSKYEKKPHARVLLTVWVTELMKHHMSYLITVPELSKPLLLLQQLLESRIASYSKIASLAGRLDLVMAQVQVSSTTNGKGNKSHQLVANHVQTC